MKKWPTRVQLRELAAELFLVRPGLQSSLIPCTPEMQRLTSDHSERQMSTAKPSKHFRATWVERRGVLD